MKGLKAEGPKESEGSKQTFILPVVAYARRYVRSSAAWPVRWAVGAAVAAVENRLGENGQVQASDFSRRKLDATVRYWKPENRKAAV